MSTGIITVLNNRKNYLIVDTGSTNVYLKRHHIVNDRDNIKVGDTVEYDKTIGGFDIQSTVDLTFKVKE